MILPVCPLSVNVPLVVPEQMVVPPLTLPATVVGLTITIVESEFAIPQEPLCTTALKAVLCVNTPEV